MDSQEKIVVKTYVGSQSAATAAFQVDAKKMEDIGYVPTSQSWAPGAYSCSDFAFALLLCFLCVGILIFIYMLVVEPAGTLSVTYELRVASDSQEVPIAVNQKTCPRCAEQVKFAAVVCRFCGHEFGSEGS